MDGVLPLAILIGASGSLLAYTRQKHSSKREKEGFDIVEKSVDDAFPQAHNDFTRKSADKYSPIMNLLNPQNNVLLPPNYTPKDSISKEAVLQKATNAAKAVYRGQGGYDVVPLKRKDLLLNKDSEGTGIRQIAFCEKVKTTDCDAFNNDSFAYTCGICLEGGYDSGANPTMGGLFITEDDRMDAEGSARRMGQRNPSYTPSVGKCAPNRFVVSKAQCLKLKKQLECQKKQNFEVEGCSQCFQDEQFRYVDNEVLKDVPSLVISGSGTLTISFLTNKTETKKYELSNTPTTIELPDFVEGSIVQLDISPASATIAGYLIGQTVGGDFRMDLIRLVQTDAVTGAKPRLAGQLSINDDNYTLMRPGVGKSSMKLNIINTFTFVNTIEEEAASCGSAPYIQKESNAKFLASSPCYQKGSGPGKYSLECLQSVFTSAGCTTEGTGYPVDTKKANGLMVDGFGTAMTIGQIAERIYNASLRAFTGKDKNGKQLSIEEWSNNSMFCLGKELRSVCDIPTADGTISTDCLNFLWKNAGAYNLKSGIGATYTSDYKPTSLDNKNPRYCTPEGTMAPINASGMQNVASIQIARSKGNADQIKLFYDNIHKKANDNTLEDFERKEAILQCYGVTLSDPKSDAALPGQLDGTTFIEIYTGNNFTGKSWKLPAGIYNFKKLMGLGVQNDAINSIRIPPNTRVIVYEGDIGSRSQEFKGNDVPNLSVYNFSNVISAIEVFSSNLSTLDYKPGRTKTPFNTVSSGNTVDSPGYGCGKMIKVGEFVLDLFKNRRDDSTGWFWIFNDGNNWNDVGQKNETYDTVWFSGVDANDDNVYDVLMKAAKDNKITVTHPQKPFNMPLFCYMLKHKTQDSMIVFSAAGYPVNIQFQQNPTLGIVGQYTGNNQGGGVINFVGGYSGAPIVGDLYELYYGVFDKSTIKPPTISLNNPRIPGRLTKLGNFKLIGQDDIVRGFFFWDPKNANGLLRVKNNLQNWNDICNGTEDNNTSVSVWLSVNNLDGEPIKPIQQSINPDLYSKLTGAWGYDKASGKWVLQLRGGPSWAYYLKHPTQDSSILFQGATRLLDLVGYGTIIMGEFKGSPQDQNGLINLIGPSTGKPLIGEVYELYTGIYVP